MNGPHDEPAEPEWRRVSLWQEEAMPSYKERLDEQIKRLRWYAPWRFRQIRSSIVQLNSDMRFDLSVAEEGKREYERLYFQAVGAFEKGMDKVFARLDRFTGDPRTHIEFFIWKGPQHPTAKTIEALRQALSKHDDPKIALMHSINLDDFEIVRVPINDTNAEELAGRVAQLEQKIRQLMEA